MAQNHVRGTNEVHAPAVSARERIDHCAYELFSRRGVRAVGIDEVVERSGVAKMTLYRHYASKDELVMAFLQRREERWTHAWLQAEVERRGGSAADRLLAVFDVFDGWFRRADFEGCSFISVMLQITEPEHPVRRAAVRHLEEIRRFLERLAAEAGADDPDALARQWHILMKGSIIAAGEGDVEAARRAREIAQHLLPRPQALARAGGEPAPAPHGGNFGTGPVLSPVGALLARRPGAGGQAGATP
jgi:AcrR family transcriptional regulator